MTDHNDIAEADRVCGISCICIPSFASRDTYRRGAYLDWIANVPKAKDVREEFGKTRACHQYESLWALDIAELAGLVVRLHLAETVDGLPKDISSFGYVRDNLPNSWTVYASARCEKSHASALCDYLTRCLTPEMRRFVAEWEVVKDGEVYNVTKTHRVGDHIFKRREAKP